MSKPEVEVWAAPLDLGTARIAALSRLLSQDELRRASRFYLDRDRRRFTASRAMLRLLLGRRLGVDPAQIDFVYGPFGKPSLKHSSLRFNVSHSAELALIAVADGSEVGVDVEFIRPQPGMQRMAERVFSRPELAQLQTATPHMQTEMFYRLWTKKEALLKAGGVGFAGDSQPAAAWSIHSITPAEGYVAAIATAPDRNISDLQHVVLD